MNDRIAARRRLRVGLTALALSTLPTDRIPIPELEVRAFDAINGLPDRLYAAAWPVMQFGALAAVPATAGVAELTGRRALAVRLLATGTTTWVLAKVVKRAVRRGRPAQMLPVCHVRGRAATGHGYLSGHAAIATALAVTAKPSNIALRRLLPAVAGVVGLSRIYVGAHLPLDVIGGAALGLTVDAGLRYWELLGA